MQTVTTPLPPAVIVLRTDVLEHHLAARYGWPEPGGPGFTTLLARDLNVTRSTVHRLLHGHMKPGEQFIAAMLRSFPHLKFQDLFDVVTPPAA